MSSDFSTPNVDVERTANGISERSRLAGLRDRAGNAVGRSGEVMRRASDSVTGQVRSHPGIAIMAGVGIGLLLGGLVFRRYSR